MTLSPNTRDLRNALGKFATGITVVTTVNENGNPVGMTVNSFSSVSLEPPLVLWCIGEDAALFKEFNQAGYFNINILAHNQQTLSNEFASTSESTFNTEQWGFNEQGLPVLTTACAVLQCQTENRYPSGDHTILIGRVLDYSYNGALPLLFHSGNYGTLQD